MKARTVSMAVVFALGVAGLAQAQEVGGSNRRLQHLMERFHKADLNNDGHLTRDEAQKGMRRVYEHFSEIDADKKGYVTLEQIAGFIEANPRPHPRNTPPGLPPPAGPPTLTP